MVHREEAHSTLLALSGEKTKRISLFDYETQRRKKPENTQKQKTHPSVIVVLTIVNLIRVSGFELFVCAAVVVVVMSRRRHLAFAKMYNCLSLF